MIEPTPPPVSALKAADALAALPSTAPPASPPRSPPAAEEPVPGRGALRFLFAILRHPWKTLAVMGLLGLIAFGALIVGLQLWVRHEFALAQEDVERYHYPEAKEHLVVCLTYWPKDPAVLLLGARVARRLGAYGLAAHYLDDYHEVRGEDDDLILERALLRVERGDLDSVSRFCRNLVSRGHPATPLVLEALLGGYLRMYRLREAEGVLALWLERQPDNVEALMYQGLMQEMRSSQNEAVATYRRVLQLDPQMDEARKRLAASLVDLTNAADALPHLEYLARRHPDDLMVKSDLARCHELLGQQEEAERILDDVIARSPRLTPALTQRGVLAIRAGDLARAEELLRQASLSSPNDYQAHYQLALCLRLRGKTKAWQMIQPRLKQIEEDNRRLRDIATQEMPFNPHNAQLHYEMGMISLRSGVPSEALRWFESALRENPDHAATHRAMALYYQRLGQRGRAARELDLAGVGAKDQSPAQGPEKVPGP